LAWARERNAKTRFRGRLHGRIATQLTVSLSKYLDTRFTGRGPYELAVLFFILRTGGIRADERDVDVLADDFIVGA